MPFGAEATRDGFRFALWAPSAEHVDLDIDGRRVEMSFFGQGWYKVSDADAKPGSRYGFAIDGAAELVPDPASRFQAEDGDRRSSVIDSCSFLWSDGAWPGRPWAEVVLCETHVGTATPEGTLAALAARLPHYKETGITAIELLPIAETTGQRTWGYDGVLPFSVNNAYGTPEELKAFVDAAHGHGLMVFLDVVYNHFGPSGNFLPGYAESFFTDRHQTPWGDGINFDGKDDASEVVREFFIHNALYWLEEYHFDGLRFDAVHAIIDEGDKHFLDELAERIRETFPDRHVHLVLENEKNEAHRLERDGDDRALAFDAQWNDDIHHCWHVLLTGERESYYSDFADNPVGRLGRCLAEGFAYQGERSKNLGRRRGEDTEGLPPQAFVAFLQNHDQIGNRAVGDRLTAIADPDKLALARAALLLSPQIPLLFMGEEWGSKTPFQFFVNFEHDPSLEDSIRKGRAKEFEKFESFSDTVPDPTAMDTFQRSKLNWGDIGVEPFSNVLAETKGLLAIRQREVLPLIRSGFIEASYTERGCLLEVTWRFEAGRLAFHANFGDEPASPDLAPGGAVIWRSEPSRASAVADLPPWAGLFVKIDAS